MYVLALKLLLAPLLVVASSLAGRRWGPRLAGILVVLPIVAGPILLILYLDHGSAFAADAARAATLGIVPLAAFALIFAYLSRRHGWLVILLTSWVTVLVADLALSRVTVPAAAALLLALLALHGADALLRRMDQPIPPPVTTTWWDLPARAIATAALVVLLTGFAAFLGPALTGALAPFPIALSVVCAFTAAQSGHAGVLALLRGIVPGLDGFRAVLLSGRNLDQQSRRCGGVWAGHGSSNLFCGLACCSEGRLKLVLVLVSDCHGRARHVSSGSGRG